MGLDERLLEHLETTGLFTPPGLVLLAVSGGPDSVALLDLMSCVGEKLGLSLAVAHVKHGISAEAAEAVPQVQELARTYGFSFFLEELALGSEATETVARQARYVALRSIQKELGASYLVTGHHQDDQVETVMFRFLRGSGIVGLAGIPSLGPDGLVRPLLPFGRAELEEWLVQRFPDPASRPPLFDDPANADTRHDRSWLRHELLPLLRQRFGPTLDSRISDVGSYAERDNAAWSAVLRALPDLSFRRESGFVEVARVPLQRYDKLLSEGILRAAAREVGCRLGRKRSTLLLDFVCESSSGHTMQLGLGWEATLVFDKLRVFRTRHTESPGAVQVELLEGEDGRLSWGGWEFVWHSQEAGSPRRDSRTTWLAYGPCEVRAPRAGDRIFPLGGVGSRKVRRLLMEARVPADERDRFPIVARGDEVLWAPGICRSEKAVPKNGQPAVRLEARAR
jgi:tRNA(Ile)-lysidine synthase